VERIAIERRLSAALPGTKVVIGAGRGRSSSAVFRRRNFSARWTMASCRAPRGGGCACIPSRTDTFGIVRHEALRASIAAFFTGPGTQSASPRRVLHASAACMDALNFPRRLPQFAHCSWPRTPILGHVHSCGWRVEMAMTFTEATPG
jgi:hypothetical protein